MSNEIIAIEGLTKRYGSFTAVDQLTLSVKQGEVFGLLGPNGAGKTTTTLMLLGLTEPSEGRAMIGGIDCTREPLKVKRIVGYLSDNMGFYPDMTGRENLRMTGRMNEMDDVPLETRIGALLERVGMAEAADKCGLTADLADSFGETESQHRATETHADRVTQREVLGIDGLATVGNRGGSAPAGHPFAVVSHIHLMKLKVNV